MPSKPIMEFDDLPQEVVIDIEQIRGLNPQRLEMEQITGITLLDTEKRQIVGFKDVTDHEFWIAGHMPTFPLMPGVLMIEGAAQLGAFYCTYVDAFPGTDFVALCGAEEIRFRGTVRPGDRLWFVGQVTKRSSRMAAFEFQGMVAGKIVVEVTILGVGMKMEQPST
ncbi:beta-hydroxyacyl-ACP dehydratase [bacterium]|nr:beta-hydroxyacyl-ACP dehydratase [bacterium]